MINIMSKNTTMKRALTSVHEQEGNGSLDSALLVHIVNVQLSKVLNIDCALELGELVYLCFVSSPVVAVLPAIDEAFKVGKWYPIISPCTL
jgi:hypothetical protein